MYIVGWIEVDENKNVNRNWIGHLHLKDAIETRNELLKNNPNIQQDSCWIGEAQVGCTTYDNYKGTEELKDTISELKQDLREVCKLVEKYR